MKFLKIPPGKNFRTIYKEIWMLESSPSEAGAKYRFAPDGHAELCFHLKQPWTCAVNGDGNIFDGTTKLVGQFSRFLDVTLPEEMKIVYVKFYPWVLYSILGIPMSEFTDNHITLDEVLKKDVLYVQEKLADCSSLIEIREVIENWLIKKAIHQKLYDQEIALFAKHILENNGAGKVHDYMSIYSRSARRLQQQFSGMVGVSPKRFLRIVRIHKATEKIKKQTSLTGIAYQLGYADQSHFVHDFKYFTGLTPKEYGKRFSPEGKCNNFSI